MNTFRKNAFKKLDGLLPPTDVEKAKKQAAQEIFQIRLAELRKKRQLRQTDVPGFSQSALSKLESRKDMKLSTLIEYLHRIGMRVEIKAYPVKGRSRGYTLVEA